METLKITIGCFVLLVLQAPALDARAHPVMMAALGSSGTSLTFHPHTSTIGRPTSSQLSLLPQSYPHARHARTLQPSWWRPAPERVRLARALTMVVGHAPHLRLHRADKSDTAPTAAGSNNKQSLVDANAADTTFNDKERKPLKLKLRQSSAKQTQPGNWKESEIVGTLARAHVATRSATDTSALRCEQQED